VTEPSTTRGRARAWQRAVLLLGVVGAAILSAIGLVSVPGDDTFTELDLIVATAAALSLAVTGAVLAWRLPAHPVGWLLWISRCLFAVALTGFGIAGLVVAANPGLASWIVVIAGVCWVPAIVCVAVLLPLVFPTGRLPSRRWRIVAAVGVTSAAFSAIQDLAAPFAPGLNAAGLVNPLAASGAIADLANLLGTLSSIAGVVCLPLVAASLVLRFRRATGVERAQLKWLAAAIAVAAPALTIAIVVQVFPGDLAAFVGNLAYLVMFVGLALLPVAIGIAVLRYRLYDIDLIIRRTVVYVPLTAILAGLYAGSTALLQRAFIAATGTTSDGAIIASTLIIATLFTPIRNWLQAAVDRRFRDDSDVKRRLDVFVRRIATAESTPDPARTLRGLLTLTVDLLDAVGGRGWLDSGGTSRLVAEIGTVDATALAARVDGGKGWIGRIELGQKRGGRSYREIEIAAVTETVRRLGPAIVDGIYLDREQPAPAASAAPEQPESANLTNEPA
jgi:hypothetical protein